MYTANYNSRHSFLPGCRHLLRCPTTESLQLSFNIQSTPHPISLNHPSKPQILSVPPNAYPLRSLMIPHVMCSQSLKQMYPTLLNRRMFLVVSTGNTGSAFCQLCLKGYGSAGLSEKYIKKRSREGTADCEGAFQRGDTGR